MTDQDDVGPADGDEVDVDVESIVGQSLEEHAERLETTADPGMGAVLDRVKVRQRRRRQLVAVGTVIAVTAAGTALLSLLPDSPTDTIAGGDADDDETGDDDAPEATTFATVPPTTPAPATTTTAPPDADTVAASATTEPAGPRISEDEQSYIVLAGDSMFAIANQHGIEADELALYNEWSDGLDHVLIPGDTIRIPPGSLIPSSETTVPASGDPADSCIYTIVAGDFPLLLAERFGITVDDLVAANSASVMNTFLPGAQLVIPGVTDCG